MVGKKIIKCVEKIVLLPLGGLYISTKYASSLLHSLTEKAKHSQPFIFSSTKFISLKFIVDLIYATRPPPLEHSLSSLIKSYPGKSILELAIFLVSLVSVRQIISIFSTVAKCFISSTFLHKPSMLR